MTIDPSIRLRSAASAMLCSAIEFYDSVIFAIFASAIGRAFFPSTDPQIELLATFAVFGAGFLARPIGSLVVGVYADKRGRRAALRLTAYVMTIATVAIALMPSYELIGSLSSILVLLARLAQGFAFGGEVGPSTALSYEIAPIHRKNLYASWQPAGQGVATMLAALMGFGLSTVLDEANLASWGWRIPFVVGALALLATLKLRNSMRETLVETGDRSGKHIVDVILSLVTNYRGVLLGIVAQIAFGTITVYVCTYMTTFALKTLAMEPAVSFMSTAVAGFAIGIGAVVGGLLADCFGHRTVIYGSRSLLLLVTYPLFARAQVSAEGVLYLAAVFPFLAMVSAGASFGLIMRSLPTRIRSTGLSISYAIVVCVFGGSIQFVIAYLVSAMNDTLVPAYCIMLATVASMLGVPALMNSKAPIRGDVCFDE